MCLDASTIKAKTAKEDMVVYKILCQSEFSENVYRSTYYLCFKWEIGKTYKTRFSHAYYYSQGKNRHDVMAGFHFFFNKQYAIDARFRYGGHVVGEFVVPKGAKYYEEFFDDYNTTGLEKGWWEGREGVCNEIKFIGVITG